MDKIKKKKIGGNKKKDQEELKGTLCVKETEHLNYKRLISQSESRNRWKNHSNKYCLEIYPRQLIEED